jgi:hypothetical protein
MGPVLVRLFKVVTGSGGGGGGGGGLGGGSGYGRGGGGGPRGCTHHAHEQDAAFIAGLGFT